MGFLSSRRDEDDEFSVENINKNRLRQAKLIKQAEEDQMSQDPELKAIIEESRSVQKETLQSTQNSVRILKETINVADGTAQTLKQQGEQLDRIEKKAEEADHNASMAYSSAKQMHKYKGLLPFSMKIFQGRKKRNKDKQMDSAISSYDRQQAKIEAYETQAKPVISAEEAMKVVASKNRDEENPYDPLEQEINQNLDEISAGLDHVKEQANYMQLEIKKHQVQMERIDVINSHTSYVLDSSQRKIKDFE